MTHLIAVWLSPPKQTSSPGWRTAWSLCLLWILVWILPDILATFIQSPAVPSPTIQAQASVQISLDCTWVLSQPELEQCIRPGPDYTEPLHLSLVFIPVSWAVVAREPGQWHWTGTDAAVAYLRRLKLTPVLVLDHVPAWVKQQGTLRDRDDPEAPMSYPHAFAQFAVQTAQRYQTQVRYFQLDSMSNVARDGFPFAASPVRYGQMTALVARPMRRVIPDLVLLSAPLQPVGTPSPAAVPPAQWLTRLQASPGQDHLDIVQWRPRIVDMSEPQSLSTLLLHDPNYFLSASATSWVYWWFPNPLHPGQNTPDSNISVFPASHWLTTTTADRSSPSPAAVGVFQGLWSRRLLPAWSWLAWFVVVVATWHQAIAAWRRLAHAVRRHAPPLRSWQIDSLMIMLTLGLIGTIILAPSWSVTSLSFVLLLGLTYLRPYPGWLVLLAALSFDHVHANVVTPLLEQPLTLSPAQILALAQFPVLCASVLRSRRDRSRPDAPVITWTVIGVGITWLLLMVFCHYQRPAATRLAQVFELEIFPLYIAILAGWFWSGHARAIRLPLAALVIGTALFATLALLAWITSPWTPDPLIQRLSGLTFSPNHAAMILLRGFWLALGLIWMPDTTRRWRWWHMGMAVVTGWALLLTFSRGALMLGLPAGLLMWGWWQYRATGRFRMPCRPSILGIGVGVAGVLLALANQRFSLGERLLDFTPVAARWAIWRHTWSLWQEHPWWGQGSDGFYWAAAAHFPHSPWLDPEILHPHNVWLEILVRAGLVGLTGMLLLCVLLGWTLDRAFRDPQAAWIVGPPSMAIAGGLAHGYVDAFWSLSDIATMNLILILVILQGGQSTNRAGNQRSQPLPLSALRSRVPSLFHAQHDFSIGPDDLRHKDGSDKLQQGRIIRQGTTH